MNREIKFRAWDKKDKYWSNDWILDQMGNFHYVVESDGRGLIIQDMNKEDEDIMEFSFFTGLHDKNGKEIWEGDIVKINEWESSTDVWNKGGLITDIIFEGGEFKPRKGISMYTAATPDIRDEMEVIGNIYENPKLIKNL